MKPASLAALRALERLEAVTAQPPACDAEPEDVLVRATDVLAAREKALRDLTAVLERDPDALTGIDGAAELRASIQERAAAWYAALVRARHVVRERATAVSRLRRLTRP